MTAKDELLFLTNNQRSFSSDPSDKDNEIQSSNLNLNQNFRCHILISVQSFKKQSNDKYFDPTTSDSNKIKEKPQPKNNFSNLSNFNDEIKEETKKCWNKSTSLNTNNSTLSLHIAAYERYIEVPSDSFGDNPGSIKKVKDAKLIFTDSLFVTQKNSFEFPRQQNDKIPNPKLSQFKSSQQLLNPNEESNNARREWFNTKMTTFNPNNRDIACFLVWKHSWKGKYKRIFSVGTLAITTYNPQTLEITNQWAYSDFVGANYQSTPARQNDNDSYFLIHFKKKNKTENMKFSSEYAQDILTLMFENKTKFAGRHVEKVRYRSFKEGWTDKRTEVLLEVGAATLFALNEQDVVVAKYHFKDIKEIAKVSDCPGGFVIAVGDKLRRHLFASQSHDKIIGEIRQNAGENLGIFIQMSKEDITLDDFRLTRLGLNSKDEFLTSYVEFRVQKHSLRHENPVRRIFCLSEKCLIERDIATYSPICARSLTSIVCLSRDLKDPQKFCIEYESGEQREYSSNERDLILASLIDGSRASSNYQIFVMSRNFEKNLRILPFKYLLDEDGHT